MYKCIVRMLPGRERSMKFPLFIQGFLVLSVFHVSNSVLQGKVCVLWCAWHLLYKNTGVTHQTALCCFLVSPLQSVSYSWVEFTGQKLRGTCPGVSEVSSVCVRKSCVSANTEEISTVQRLASSRTPSVSPWLCPDPVKPILVIRG